MPQPRPRSLRCDLAANGCELARALGEVARLRTRAIPARLAPLRWLGLAGLVGLAACAVDTSPKLVDMGAAGVAAVGGGGGKAGGPSAAGRAGGGGVTQTQAGSGGGGGRGRAGTGGGGSGGHAAQGGGGSAAGSGGGATTSPDDRPAAGNPDGHCDVPADAALEDVSNPTTVVGTGTPASCTGSAFVAAVAKGGVITFDCGPDPATITLTTTAKVFNDKGPKIVIDGANKITLSGADKTRILYQDTCDQAQVWTNAHCDDQPDPLLTVQNLTFEHGSSKGQTYDGGGGGAIFARGGRLKILNSRFFNNSCDDTGPDVGGAAVRALDQSGGKPAYVVNSTFGGRTDLANVCSNGGGLSTIGVSYSVLNSVLSYNQAIGHGANPAADGTPGGGSGGAIYNDGDTYTLTVCGSLIEHNSANEGGGAIFFVSDDDTGSLVITDSTLRANPSLKFETDGYPGIFVKTDNKPLITNSMLTK
jgi:hypothetical protein